MPTFDSDGVRIAYEVAGAGPPVVLVHGFASTLKRNWKEVRWFATLANAGRQVIALDCRGHGESEKPHEAQAYHTDSMVGDVVRLMDHVGVSRAAIMGYSMGGRIVAELLIRYPQRLTCAILAGIGRGVLGERRDAEAIARVLEAQDAATITHPVGKAFRQFAEQGGNDLQALAACMRGFRSVVDDAALATLRTPVLIVAGDRDELIGDPSELARLIPGARLVVVPGRDHLSTVGDRRYKEAVVGFLAAKHL